VSGVCFPFWRVAQDSSGDALTGLLENQYLADPPVWDELALSQWGLWADELDQIDLTMLQTAYIRRKRWEANLFAANIWATLGRAMNKQPDPIDLTEDFDQAASFIKKLGGQVG
jgi:hypothetical protein